MGRRSRECLERIVEGRSVVLVLFGMVMLSGCLMGEDGFGEGGESVEPAASGSEAGDIWEGGDRLTVVDHEHDVEGGFEADVLCTSGGGPIIPRTGAPVAVETDQLEITISVEPVWTGIQVGYVVDGTNAGYATGEEKEITWLETVYPTMEETFHVSVGGDQFEEPGPDRWSFYYQVNPGLEEACYTGGGSGTWAVTIDAVRE